MFTLPVQCGGWMCSIVNWSDGISWTIKAGPSRDRDSLVCRYKDDERKIGTWKEQIRLALCSIHGAKTIHGSVSLPLPEEGFLHWRTLQVTLYVGLGIVDECGDGSQRAQGLCHAAIAVVNSCGEEFVLLFRKSTPESSHWCSLLSHLICIWT